MIKQCECTVCGNSNNQQLDYIPQYAEYVLMHCKNCGLKFMLSENYEVLGDDVYWDEVNKQIYANPFVLEEFRKKHNKYLKYIKKYKGPNMRLLDVGCGNGIFVKNAKDHGFDAYGIEPSEIAVELCKKQYGIQPFHGYLTIDSDLPKNYGVLTAWDVIEHVENPKEFLAICHAHLEQGGTLLLETPDESCLIRKIINIIDRFRRMFGSKSSLNIYYPSHRYYFTHDSIKSLLDRAGFTNVKIYKEHSIYSKSKEKYRLYRKLTNKQLLKYNILYSILKFPLFWNKQVILCTKK